VHESVEQALACSNADACIVIGRRQTVTNVRWANNTVTTNGEIEQVSLTVVSVIGRRVASITKTHCPAVEIERMVRESENACRRRPEAPDFMPLVDPYGESPDWAAPSASSDIHVFDRFAPRLKESFERARRDGLATFGYADDTSSTIWLGTSAGLRRRHDDRVGRVSITGKTPDLVRSTWVGTATRDFDTVDPAAMLETLAGRLSWSSRQLTLPAGSYEVLLEPSCTADLALVAYSAMARRDADEGRSAFSSPAGGTRLGERLFGRVTMYSDPGDAAIPTAPFHAAAGSDEATSVFDNGLNLARTEWVRDGELRALITPRYWAERVGAEAPAPYIDNLIVPGDGPTLEQMIANTERALLITCLWYIRTVDPQTALVTGLTRDGVFLVEDGRVRGAVNNFRWNMSPIAAFAQTTEIGRSGAALPREHDEFLRVRTPPVRIVDFNMSSVSQAR
jgi:predicted Zn-dependent protease